MIPTFAGIIAGIYREADKASDARSPWLLWLTPDGRTIELFDVREPAPSHDRLPAEFVALFRDEPIARPN
jgi:hypothetical protein